MQHAKPRLKSGVCNPLCCPWGLGALPVLSFVLSRRSQIAVSKGRPRSGRIERVVPAFQEGSIARTSSDQSRQRSPLGSRITVSSDTDAGVFANA
jgi:hypothetical protein